MRFCPSLGRGGVWRRRPRFPACAVLCAAALVAPVDNSCDQVPGVCSAGATCGGEASRPVFSLVLGLCLLLFFLFYNFHFRDHSQLICEKLAPRAVLG